MICAFKCVSAKIEHEQILLSVFWKWFSCILYAFFNIFLSFWFSLPLLLGKRKGKKESRSENSTKSFKKLTALGKVFFFFSFVCYVLLSTNCKCWFNIRLVKSSKCFCSVSNIIKIQKTDFQVGKKIFQVWEMTS